MIGGGEGAFIGGVHRMAARLDGRYQLVAGVFSSDAEKTKRSAVALGVDPARAYPSVEAMIAAEKQRADGVEVVSVVTPAMFAMSSGLSEIRTVKPGSPFATFNKTFPTRCSGDAVARF